ncbi:uncharacterized protein K02A2.6-like [Chenopodium quinoa]|uniref:uncharacterized protein K02A2.6-like n=1 Tax=Chenopodium quinoa TaxID=63459 RepID=UPI000B78C700|nr:uncharacterized protein K02A2.6-like [Chenopodium quinoa]
MASKKLRPYFLTYSIVVYTDQPPKKPFITLEASGRMLKWALEMRGFDITFEPRKEIKGQAFADFLAEMTRPDLQPAGDQVWKVFVDGSATATGCGAGYYVLDDLHQGQCDSHIGGRALAEKAAHLGYYWPSLKSDAMKMVKKCDKCQRFATLIHRPANSLSAISSPLPFSKWGMDILGPYTPASSQRCYVFVAVEYFTKWVEAEAVRGIKWTDVSDFIWKSIITRFGVPQSMVFDNGPQFETPQLKGWLEDQGIAHCFSSVGRPQANGQVEAYNKLISNGIKRELKRAGGLWADELVNVLWSIRTMAKSSTGETPFFLFYGAEVVLPIEMYESTLRVMLYDEAAN